VPIIDGHIRFININTVVKRFSVPESIKPVLLYYLLSVRFQSRLVLDYYCIHACAATLPFPLSTTTELQRWQSGRPRNGHFPPPTTTAPTTVMLFSPSSCASPSSSCAQVSPVSYYVSRSRLERCA